jgi:hypothetical protein
MREQSCVRQKEVSHSFSFGIDLRMRGRSWLAAKDLKCSEIRSQELHSGAVEAAFVIIVESIRRGECVRLSLPKRATPRVGKANGGGRHTLADAKAKKMVDTT